jgi:lipoprotein-anchoring transpeptidase ErfK/SrfK
MDTDRNRYRRASGRRWWTTTALSCAALIALMIASAAHAATSPTTVEVFFGQGEQLVAVQRSGSTVQDALQALIAGPTPAELRSSLRSYVPAGTTVRRVTVSGGIADVDLGEGYIKGPATDTTLARLDQVVRTATAVPGISSVLLTIDGGTPLGVFPGVDATVPLTPAMLATPNVAPTTPNTPPSTPHGPVSASTRAVQTRLAALGYLLPSNVDGVNGPATETAIVAFQKWQGLSRTGLADAHTRKVLAGAMTPTPIDQGAGGRRIEVLVDRQLVLAIQDDKVVRAIAVSTGKPSTPTPIGSFHVYAQFPRWWSTPFREWLLWASPFTGGVAMHQYPDVPVDAASHGCVRVTQYDAEWLYHFVSVGTPVHVIASSR